MNYDFVCETKSGSDLTGMEFDSRDREPYEIYQVYRRPAEFRNCYLTNKKRTVLPGSLPLFNFFIETYRSVK